MDSEIQTHNTEVFRGKYIKPEIDLDLMLKSDFGKFVIAVPMKYIYGNPALVKVIGQVHGVLFLLFVFNTLRVGVE
jgi:hypothetical protein